MSPREERNQGLIFLLPHKVINEKHFSKRDVLQIKNNINSNLTIIRLIIAGVLYFVSMVLMISMNNATGGKQIEVYGLGSTISQIISMLACLLTISTLLISIFSKNKKLSAILKRVGSITLYIGLAAQMLIGIYADAEQGFTARAEETMSASIVIISIVMLIQPAFWLDAIILNGGTIVSLIALSLYCADTFGMKGVHYYILVAVIFPVACYFVVTLLFYAEAQHYCDVLENAMLNDKAYYDNLTKCKNRHALTDFLKNKSKELKGKTSNLLIILFDIDDFKKYNDQFSHLGGDYCLRSIADAVRKEFVSPSLDFFRYGGEEFLLFFDLNDKNEAPIIMEKVRNVIKNLKLEAPKGAPKNYVTISLGGVLIEKLETFDFNDELALVDKYLYIAKANGKDVSCYNGELI